MLGHAYLGKIYMSEILKIAISMLAAATSDGGPVTQLEIESDIPAQHDSCLDHSVRELGMSAKRVEKERRWNIGPQFVHPSIVPAGTVRLEMKPATATTTVKLTVTWPGGLKEKAQQAEIEERVTLMAQKMAQTCGVTLPKVRCSVAAPGQAMAVCQAPSK